MDLAHLRFQVERSLSFCILNIMGGNIKSQTSSAMCKCRRENLPFFASKEYRRDIRRGLRHQQKYFVGERTFSRQSRWILGTPRTKRRDHLHGLQG